jgi:hypothetical protein
MLRQKMFLPKIEKTNDKFVRPNSARNRQIAKIVHGRGFNFSLIRSNLIVIEFRLNFRFKLTTDEK